MSDWDAGAGALIKGNEGLMFRLVSHMNCSNNFLSKTIFATCSQGWSQKLIRRGQLERAWEGLERGLEGDLRGPRPPGPHFPPPLLVPSIFSGHPNSCLFGLCKNQIPWIIDLIVSMQEEYFPRKWTSYNLMDSVPWELSWNLDVSQSQNSNWNHIY